MIPCPDLQPRSHRLTCNRVLTRARPQVATAICTVLPIWESRAGLIVVVANMVRCRPAVDEQALAELTADLEKPHMARVPGARMFRVFRVNYHVFPLSWLVMCESSRPTWRSHTWRACPVRGLNRVF